MLRYVRLLHLYFVPNNHSPIRTRSTSKRTLSSNPPHPWNIESNRAELDSYQLMLLLHFSSNTVEASWFWMHRNWSEWTKRKFGLERHLMHHLSASIHQYREYTRTHHMHRRVSLTAEYRVSSPGFRVSSPGFNLTLSFPVTPNGVIDSGQQSLHFFPAWNYVIEIWTCKTM